MAVDFVGVIHVYRGLTADEKPLGNLIPVGSTFTEKDGLRRTWTKAAAGHGEEWDLSSRDAVLGAAVTALDGAVLGAATAEFQDQSLAQGREIIKQLKKLNED